MVRSFEKKDFDQLEKWFKYRNLYMNDVCFFPPTGFIYPGVAAGFLYTTDSAIGIIDSFISNPYSNGKERDKALNGITECLLGAARQKGCKLVKCDTQLEAIETRAKRFGFKYNGLYCSLSLEL